MVEADRCFSCSQWQEVGGYGRLQMFGLISSPCLVCLREGQKLAGILDGVGGATAMLQDEQPKT